MKRLHSKAKALLWASLLAAGAVGFAGLGPKARAADTDAAAKNERCAVRVSIGLVGTAPSADLAASTTPQAQVDALLKTPEFIERFARFSNQRMNNDPGQTALDDTAYYMAKHVLTNNLKWSDMFLSKLSVVSTGTGANLQLTVQPAADGLGMFRSPGWLTRYAGNELAGLKISTAYRMMQNTLGLKLVASTNAPGADVSAAGRAGGVCKSCHFDNWYALDKVADVLTRVDRTDPNNIKYTPAPNPGVARNILGGKMVTDDVSLATTLVNSDQYNFNACRTAFQYLYGRDENACESTTFDACVDAFKTSGLIQTAIATVAKDPGFCQ